MFGAVEAGGTKFVCAVGTDPDNIAARVRVDTTTPEKTLPEVLNFFVEQSGEHGPLKGIGIGSFGPVDPDPASDKFGWITATPKAGWSQTDLVGTLRKEFDVPYGFDTDVNAAALGEHRWGAAQGLDTFLYLTVGTGLGGGGLQGGQLMHGLIHPEMGHMRIPHDVTRDPFPGACPFHNDCWEGLAAGPAIGKRWGKPAEELPPDHEAWELEAEYLALGLNNLVCTVSPQRIILGGGVCQQQGLLDRVRTKLAELLNGYVQHDRILNHMDEFVVPPALGNNAGILGCIALAEQAAAG